jgi:hypothetical protein
VRKQDLFGTIIPMNSSINEFCSPRIFDLQIKKARAFPAQAFRGFVAKMRRARF